MSFTDPQGGVTNYVHDSLNRETSLTDFSSRTFTFGYDALGLRTNLTRPNGVNTNYAYDNLSRLLSVSHLAGSSALDGATYSYDAAGNRTSKTSLLSNITSAFTYDPTYQLLNMAQGAQTKENYTYDPVGNRLSSPGAPYTYNSSNEMTAREGVPYSYDSNGNRTAKTNGGGTTTYNWDFENRLTSVVLPGTGGAVSLKYDPFGRRIEKTSPSGSTIYVYDGDDIIEELNADGSIGERYTNGSGIDEPLVGQRQPKIFYYEADGLGSVTSLTDPTGAVAATYTYDSFGFMTASMGSATNWYRYTARQFDSDTALYYYRARYYDPTVGRFLSEDPIKFDGGVNFYAYVSNNPVIFLDPFGYFEKQFPTTWTKVPGMGSSGSTIPHQLELFETCVCQGNGHYKLQLKLVEPLDVTYTDQDALRHEQRHVSLTKNFWNEHSLTYEHYEETFPSDADCEYAKKATLANVNTQLRRDSNLLNVEQNQTEDAVERAWNFVRWFLTGR